MHLLYLTFGSNLNIHLQAQFSIFSFLRFSNNINTINIITDKPGMYSNVKEWVNVISITDETLKTWRGEYDFFWRIKIKAIEMVCNLYPNQAVMYLDTDTFLFGDPTYLVTNTIAGKAFMHENEGTLFAEKSKTANKMGKQVSNQIFGGVTIQPTQCMWNAGVVLTPNTTNNKENLLAISICDAMCHKGVTRRLIEQFALSVALEEVYGLMAAEKVIGHYWSNKDNWNNVIKDFFLTATFSGKTNNEIVEEIKNFKFDQLPVKVKVRSTNAKLKALIDKWYAPKIKQFANKHLE